MDTDMDTATRRSLLVLAVALAVTAALIAGVTVLGASSGSEEAAGEQMLAVSPGGHVELDELDPELRQLYLDVAADPGPFEHVRCYCGCEQMLDHRHLLDCFERPDGGWERHAVGCAICQVEARDVLAGLAAGRSVAEISAAIDETYASITEDA